MRIIITTDDGELVSLWKDSDDDDRVCLAVRGPGAAMNHLDSQLTEDMAHDIRIARARDGRDVLTGEKEKDDV